ncbi:MAG TPA: DinB family protein [Bacillota bacterium]|nr:DinB family protein [Bacillota bacterium]
MSIEIVLPMWSALRDRFQDKIKTIPEEELHKSLGDTSIGDLLYHTAEVEYMFAAWFFDWPKETDIIRPETMQGHVQLLHASNEHFIQGMKNLSEENWQLVRSSALGDSTPVEAVGRLMNHAGIHSGQISYIQTYGSVEE